METQSSHNGLAALMLRLQKKTHTHKRKACGGNPATRLEVATGGDVELVCHAESMSHRRRCPRPHLLSRVPRAPEDGVCLSDLATVCPNTDRAFPELPPVIQQTWLLE